MFLSQEYDQRSTLSETICTVDTLFNVKSSENICRACLNRFENTEMESLFCIQNSSVISMLHMFISCTALQVSETDEYPKQICKSCTAELSKAFEFRTKCHNSIKELNKVADNTDFKHIMNVELDLSIVKSEVYNTTEDNDSSEFDSTYSPPVTRTKPKYKSQKSVKIKKSQMKIRRKRSKQKCDLECTICGKSFDGMRSLNEHRKHHQIIKSCSRCRMIFNTIEEYTEHIKTHNKFLCPDCGYFCKTLSGFQGHLASHSDERPHKCETCGKKYKSVSALRSHMHNHSEEKRFKCDYCGETFKTWNSKSSHVRTRHMDIIPHTCTICNREFKQTGKLTVHMRQHTGEKPYKCPECPMAFAVISTRNRHLLVHSGEKNYPCTVCDKRFARLSGVRQHMNTHTGERKYPCEVCGKAFTQAHVLRTHRRIHGENPAVLQANEENY